MPARATPVDDSRDDWPARAYAFLSVARARGDAFDEILIDQGTADGFLNHKGARAGFPADELQVCRLLLSLCCIFSRLFLHLSIPP